MGFQIGHAKSDITAFFPNIVMLGYGNPKNTVHSVDTAVSVRTFWIKSEKTNREFIFINLELCFVTQALTDAVWEEVKNEFPNSTLKRDQLIFTAQHTHSAPSGFTHYAIYNTPTEGFSPKVLNTIKEGVINSLKMAHEKMRPAKIFVKKGEFKLDIDISFNRSLCAYNNNEEIQSPLIPAEQNKAVNREMVLLEFVDKQGTFGVINYFAVHCTNILWSNHYISPGNKGYASLYLEEYFKEKHGRQDFLAAFNQGNAGDVSPIFTPPWWQSFIPRDDLKMIQKSKDNGKLQYLGAVDFLKNKGIEIHDDEMDSELIYVDMGNVQIENQHLPEKYKGESLMTSSPCLGVAFIRGSEGAGIVTPLAWMVILITNFIKYFEYFLSLFKDQEFKQSLKRKMLSQAPKNIFVEAGNKKVLGTRNIMGLLIPNFFDSSIAYFKKVHKNGGVREHTWTQQILPLQISIMGGFAFIGIPAETTTMAGERIRKALIDIFSEKHGFKDVLLCPYSNSYCGYITTPEEYDKQCYEGGHTVFGKWTQPAFQTELVKLAIEMMKPKEQRLLNRELLPPQFSKNELDIRTKEFHQLHETFL